MTYARHHSLTLKHADLLHYDRGVMLVRCHKWVFHHGSCSRIAWYDVRLCACLYTHARKHICMHVCIILCVFVCVCVLVGRKLTELISPDMQKLRVNLSSTRHKSILCVYVCLCLFVLCTNFLVNSAIQHHFVTMCIFFPTCYKLAVCSQNTWGRYIK